MDFKFFKNTYSKIKHSFFHKYDKERMFNIAVTFFGIIGFCWTLIELSLWLFHNTTFPNSLRDFVNAHIGYFILLVLIISVFINRRRIKIIKKFSRTDLAVIIEFCDIFEVEGATIIPVMDTFDNDIANGFVSSSSVHGQFIRKYYNDNVNDLDNAINNYFIQINKTPIETDINLKGNNKRYKIGTTCTIRSHNKHFYLSALTYMTTTGNIRIEPKFIFDFLLEVWSFIPKHGQYCETVNIPVIGTGISRLPAEYTNQAIVFEIIKSFFITSKQQTFCRTLRICLNPENYSYYDFKAINNYLDYLNDFTLPSSSII